MICAGRTSEQCGTADKKDDPVDFTFVPAKGELFRLALISADGNAKAFFAVVPDPIRANDNGCSLSVLRLLPNFELAIVLAEGYVAGEDLQFSARVYDETQNGHVRAGR